MSRRKLVDLSLLDSKPEDKIINHTGAPGTPVGEIAPNHFDALIDMARKGSDVHFVTGGKWSMYEFLERALKVTGPAQLWLSTFSITELSARMLSAHQDAGDITELHMLIDYRAKVRYPEVYQLASNIATRIRQTPVHAKVMVLHGLHATITMVGSANWTENPRIEAGVITCNTQIAAFHLAWLNTALDNGNIFE